MRTVRKGGNSRLSSTVISILRVFSLLNAVRNLPVVYLGKSGVRNADLKRNFGHPDGEVSIA